MKNLTISFLLLLFGTTNLFAQQNLSTPKATVPKCVIKGQFVDSLTKETEPYATIRVENKANPQKPVSLAVTDKDGKVNISIPAAAGSYTMTLSSVGKNTIIKTFTLKTDTRDIDFGKIYTKEAAHNLKGVEVVAQKPLVKMDVDKLTYDMEADPDSKTSTAMDMLRKVPLVTVEGNDEIKVNGSSSFKIYVNGKPNTMMSKNPKEVLKSLPANTIKKIEVITSPGAKYDAEGTAGILNIVTTGVSMQGYSATLNASVGTRQESAGAYLTTKFGKLTISTNYQYSHFNEKNFSNYYRENYNSDTQKYLEQNGTGKSNGSFQYGTVEASYEIDSLRLLSTSFTLYRGSSNDDNNNITAMWNSNRSMKTYGYSCFSDGNSNWSYIDGTVDYQRTSKRNSERVLTLSYKLSASPQNSKSYLSYKDVVDPTGLDIVKMYLLNNSYSKDKEMSPEQTFQADYSTPLGKMHKLEFGAKYILRNNTSNDQMYMANGVSDDYVYNNDRSSHYKNINDIFAGYLSYQFKYKFLSIMPGLRYEYTHQSIKYLSGAISSDANFKTHYDDWVPSITMKFQVGKTQSLKLGYNMRISRPGIWNLNPYFDNKDPMTINQGNSNLKSEKSNNINLSYSSFSIKNNMTVQFMQMFEDNSIERVSHLVGTDGEWFDDHKHFATAGAMYTTYANIGKTRNTGLSLYDSWTGLKNFQIYTNAQGGYTHLESSAQNLKNYGWNLSAYVGMSYNFPCKLRIGFNGGGSTPRYRLQGKSSGYHWYGIYLQQRLLKDDRLTLSISTNNVFEKYNKWNNTTIGKNFLSRSDSKYQSRYIGFSISYRIGNLKANVKKTEKSIENNDVNGGGKSSQGSGGQGGQGGN